MTSSNSLKFHEIVKKAVKVFLVCRSFFPQSFVVFFVFYILSFNLFIHFTDRFLCNPRISFILSTFPSKSLVLFCTHTHTHSLSLYINYLAHISSTSTALPHSHFHIWLHQTFPLEHLAISVVDHITSPDPILVFLSGTLWLSSINCSCSQPVSCGQSWYRL